MTSHSRNLLTWHHLCPWLPRRLGPISYQCNIFPATVATSGGSIYAGGQEAGAKLFAAQMQPTPSSRAIDDIMFDAVSMRWTGGPYGKSSTECYRLRWRADLSNANAHRYVPHSNSWFTVTVRLPLTGKLTINSILALGFNIVTAKARDQRPY
jgi:hypothetical protein